MDVSMNILCSSLHIPGKSLASTWHTFIFGSIVKQQTSTFVNRQNKNSKHMLEPMIQPPTCGWECLLAPPTHFLLL